MKNADCLVLILGGGRGTRLFPLTMERSKPAIGFAGKYRLIDIPVSNCLNSGYNKIFVLTQFLTASLHGHLMETYQFDNFSKGFVQILSAEQSHKSSEWFHGTADAVRQVLRHLRYQSQDYVLILSGDHLYKMDYRKLLAYHIDRKADVTVASVLVDADDARRMGVLDCAACGKLNRLVEKPERPDQLNIMVKSAPGSDDARHYLASMGVYLFNKEVLFEILTRSQAEDFGKHILPLLINEQYNVYAYEYPDYWRDIGTVASYYQASMDLLSPQPAFDLFDESWPLLTRARYLPPSRMVDSRIDNVLIAEGCLLREVVAERSIIGLRSTIDSGTVIKDSVLMGNDYYVGRFKEAGATPRIGPNVHIERAIIDKNVTIGEGCRISSKAEAPDQDGDSYYVREGITIVRRGVELKPYTVI